MNSRISVLIVDDDKLQRDTLAKFLLKNELTVYTAQDGESAISFLQEVSVDILVLDYFMPDIDGITLMNRLRNSKNTKNTPVIMVSSDEIIVQNCTFIKKPFKAEDLLASILTNYKKSNNQVHLQSFKNDKYLII